MFESKNFGVVWLLVSGLVSFNSSAATPDLEELWKIVQKQQVTIEELTAKLEAAVGAATAAKEQLVSQEEQLAEQSERIDATAEVLDETSSRANVASSWTERTKVWGYGELHYNNLQDDAISADGAADDLERVDVHRFIFGFNHEFNDWLRFSSEVEIEHSVAGDGQPGEVEIEQMWIEADLNQNHHVRAGLDILPIGLINRTHEPNTFYGVERNMVEAEIIPSTWWEAGIALYGEVMPGLNYDLVLHSGLVMRTDGSSAFRPRSGRLKVAEADNQDIAFTGALRYTGYPGLEIGISGQYQNDYTGNADAFNASASLIEAHVDYQSSVGLGLRALFAQWDLGSDGALDPGTRDAETLTGWYVEPSYKLGRDMMFSFIPGEVGVFARYSEWDERDNLGINMQEFERFDVGMNYWPHPNVVFKLDLQWEDADDPVDNMLDGFNLGLGYQF